MDAVVGARRDGGGLGKTCPLVRLAAIVSFLLAYPHLRSLSPSTLTAYPPSFHHLSAEFSFLAIPFPRPTAHRRDNRKLKKLLSIDTWRCLVSTLLSPPLNLLFISSAHPLFTAAPCGKKVGASSAEKKKRKKKNKRRKSGEERRRRRSNDGSREATRRGVPN